jgi:molecular chaperone GrpE
MDHTTDCLEGNKGAMTEENKSVDAANDAANQPPIDVVVGESIAETVEAVATPDQSDATIAAPETIPELVDGPELVDAIAVEPLSESATAAASDDETDYEAAFMDLRSTYAAKERECEALKADAEERQGQYLRMAADFENFRRRSQKEKEDLEVHVKCTTINELLSVVDNFERARAQIKPQNDGEMALHKSYQGVYKDLVDRLKKVGVSPMRAEGQPFDPNFHNAVMREPTADHPEGTVIEELMRGYLIGEKVLRHAMVKVATPPEEDDVVAAAPAE